MTCGSFRFSLPFSVILSIVHFFPLISPDVCHFLFRPSPTDSNNQIRLNLPVQMSNDCVSLCVSCSWQCFTVQVSQSLLISKNVSVGRVQSAACLWLFLSFCHLSVVVQNALGGRLSFIHASYCNTLQHRRRRMQRADIESHRLGTDWSAGFTPAVFSFIYFLFFGWQVDRHLCQAGFFFIFLCHFLPSSGEETDTLWDRKYEVLPSLH